MRGGEVVSHWSHKPEIASSIIARATFTLTFRQFMPSFLDEKRTNKRSNQKR